jgi:prepilin-type N-terminal cleavage/methylation domain-containing protein
MRNGYTLVEILVALTVIGLLFSFGFVSFRDFSRRQAVADAAKSIQGDLRLAQGNAITGQKPMPDCGAPKTLDSYSFNIISTNSPSEYRIEANCGGTPVIVKDVTMPTDITIKNPAPSPNPLKFKILGQGTNISSGSNWVLTLIQTGTGNTTNVTVTSGGEIR